MNSDLQALLKDGEGVDGGGGGGGGDGGLSRLKTPSAADKAALYEPKGMLKFIVQKVGDHHISGISIK